MDAIRYTVVGDERDKFVRVSSECDGKMMIAKLSKKVIMLCYSVSADSFYDGGRRIHYYCTSVVSVRYILTRIVCIARSPSCPIRWRYSMEMEM